MKVSRKQSSEDRFFVCNLSYGLEVKKISDSSPYIASGPKLSDLKEGRYSGSAFDNKYTLTYKYPYSHK